MTAWEYLIVSLPAFEAAKATRGHSEAVDLLNREGAEGWEATGMTTLADASVAVLLKRPTTHDHDARRDRSSQPGTGRASARS